MGKLIDLTGKRFGRLTVIERAENANNGHTRWLCQCDCGGKTIVERGDLCTGKVKSCGCLNKEIAVQIGTLGATHGKSNTRLYNIWSRMKARCYNSKDTFYKIYGGRGISVCSEWRNDFQTFCDWAVSHGYCEGLTIDRIDNDKGYSPDNCRWASRTQQVRNRKVTKKYALNGESKTLAEWCEIYQKGYSKVWARVLRSGWTIEEALDLVPRKK